MRKVLSFVLVLALVLSSFSMAFAADTKSTVASLTDIAGNANEDAIKVNFDLGIVTGNPDGTFQPAKAVNRAEFAAMITRALDIPDSALAGYTSTSFKDTAGYSWAVPYLAFCQSKGILLGDGAGNVMPGKTITVNEAMTMALRAIGYTANSSLLVGAWPANYVSIAQNNDMYDDVAATTTVDKASAAQIIYNLLTVQKVAVNSDGTTDLQWKDKGDDVIANLLNTNLGCDEAKDVILGASGYSYDDSKINITGDIGAYGTAYTDDDEVVAFTKDSSALTGKLNDDGDKFKVGDVEYKIADADITSSKNDTTEGALFVNTDRDADHSDISIADIRAYALANSNDGETVTLNVDLSGKTIKDVYSVVAWSVAYKDSDADKAADDVQSDIADKDLLKGSFVENDDDAIDMNSFELVGVASLDKIAEDNVLYVYTNKDGDIRKVEVGTEKVEGAVDELDTGDETVTVAGKEYDLAPTPTVAAITISDIDTDSEGTFFLDANKEIYDFDGTGSVDTYAIVKSKVHGDDFDNMKLKLYKSDDSTSTYYVNDDNVTKLDWTTGSASYPLTFTGTTDASLSTNELIGYALDSNGEIDTINATAALDSNATFKSTKLLKTTSDGSVSIDADAVVFTYKGANVAAGTDFDVCTLKDVTVGTFTKNIAYILNDDGDVAALFVSADDADTDNDAIYGVINKRTSTKDADGDTVYKFAGYIDGASFTYTTNDDTNEGGAAYTTFSNSNFGVYAFTLDASNAITKIENINAAGTFKAKVGTTDGATGLVAYGQVTDLKNDNTTLTIYRSGMTPSATDTFAAEDDAVVYKYSKSDKEYTVSKLSSIDKGDNVMLYDTKGDDADGAATIVIYWE